MRGISCTSVTVEDGAVDRHSFVIHLSKCWCNRLGAGDGRYPGGDDVPGERVQNDGNVAVLILQLAVGISLTL